MSGALGAHGVSVVGRVEEGSRSGQERASEVTSVLGVALSLETAAWNSVLQVSGQYVLRKVEKKKHNVIQGSMC
jgi:hypothetical protein